MRVTGIISEYNPFHNGHLRQIEHLREAGSDLIICVMSGNVTQRGEFAITDKYTRAAAVVGADLVLELPFPFSTAGAEYFASAGVALLDGMGVGEINFGSECGDIDLLRRGALSVSKEDFISRQKETRDAGLAELFVGSVGSAAGFVPFSNDLLAMAVINAAQRQEIKAELTTVKREGAGYGEKLLCEGEYPSATALRETLRSAKGTYPEICDFFVPPRSAEIYKKAVMDGMMPTDPTEASAAFLYYFRRAEAARRTDFDADKAEENGIFAEAGGGVFERLCRASLKATDIDGLFTLAATKRYTSSRLRRAALFSMCGVTAEELKKLPAYTTLLASTGRGRAYLKERKKSGCEGISVITKPADFEKADGKNPPSSNRINAQRQAYLTNLADALFTQTLPEKQPSDIFIRQKPYKFD